MQRKRSFSAALGSVYLDDPAAREAADAERHVQGDGAGRDDLDWSAGVVTEPHDGAAAELALDLRERDLQGLVPVATARALAATRLVVRCHLKLLSGKNEGLRRATRVRVALSRPPTEDRRTSLLTCWPRHYAGPLTVVPAAVSRLFLPAVLGADGRQ